MFEQITQRFSQIAARLSGARLSPGQLQALTRDIRDALIEADVAVEIAEQFAGRIQSKLSTSDDSSTPVVEQIKQELIALMGAGEDLVVAAKPPVVIMLVGLQGAGKTTTAAKLSYYLKERKSDPKKVALVSCDVHRPAAVQQLKVLAEQIGCQHYPTDEDAIVTARTALLQAQQDYVDVLVVDTAGRLHVDQDMMDEVCAIQREVAANEVLFVLDSMSGQDALHSSRAFSEALPLSGIILSKFDGESRGGSAISARSVIGQPVKFIGVGEKIDALQPFRPERIASRILGQGELETLVEQYQKVSDSKQSEKLAQKLSKGGFDLEDLRNQLLQVQQMGGIGALVDKLPGMAGKAKMAEQAMGGEQITKMLAVIDSMTRVERQRPGLMNGSRKRRVANGSGTQIQDVNRVLKQFEKTQKLLRKGGKIGRLASMMGKPGS